MRLYRKVQQTFLKLRRSLHISVVSVFETVNPPESSYEGQKEVVNRVFRLYRRHPNWTKMQLAVELDYTVGKINNTIYSVGGKKKFADCSLTEYDKDLLKKILRRRYDKDTFCAENDVSSKFVNYCLETQRKVEAIYAEGKEDIRRINIHDLTYDELVSWHDRLDTELKRRRGKKFIVGSNAVIVERIKNNTVTEVKGNTLLLSYNADLGEIIRGCEKLNLKTDNGESVVSELVPKIVRWIEGK